MGFSSNPWLFIESYIYLMRKVIIKIEFVSNALTNQMTQPELHYIYVLKVIFSTSNLLIKLFITTMALTFTFAIFCFLYRCSLHKRRFYRKNVWPNFQAHKWNFFIRNIFAVKHKGLLLTRRWILLLKDEISSFKPYSVRLLWLNWKEILRTEIHCWCKNHLITGWSV